MTFKQTSIAAVLLSSAMLLSSPAISQDADAVLQALDDALPGTFIHNPMDLQWDQRGPNKKLKLVDAPDLPSGQAISIRIKKKTDKPWDTVVFTEMDSAVSKGETVEIHFWARTARPRAGQDTADVTLYVGRNEEPYDYIISEDIKPSQEWNLYTVRGTADANYSAGKVKAEFQLGKAAQTIELGEFYASKLPAEE